MIDFGFGISPSSRMDLNRVDQEKYARLVKLEPDVTCCIGCGSCTASCSAGVFSRTSLRSALLALQNGKEQEALSLLGACMFCGKCLMVCPRGLNTRHMILSIHKIYSET